MLQYMLYIHVKIQINKSNLSLYLCLHCVYRGCMVSLGTDLNPPAIRLERPPSGGTMFTNTRRTISVLRHDRSLLSPTHCYDRYLHPYLPPLLPHSPCRGPRSAPESRPRRTRPVGAAEAIDAPPTSRSVGPLASRQLSRTGDCDVIIVHASQA